MKFLFRHGILSLALLLAINFLLINLTNRYILTADFYEANGNTFSVIPGQGSAVYDALQKWVYFYSAIYLLTKLLIISLILHTALFLQDRETPFSPIFKIVILAEFIFLIPASVKLLSFNYTVQHGNLLEWHKYSILSALSLIGDVPADWYYAFQSLNLFEFAYWFILAVGISKITGDSFDKSLRTVLFSYVPSLIIWVVFVTFLSLMMFPATG